MEGASARLLSRTGSVENNLRLLRDLKPAPRWNPPYPAVDLPRYLPGTSPLTGLSEYDTALDLSSLMRQRSLTDMIANSPHAD